MGTAQKQEDLSKNVKDVRSVLRKAPNWKAAGPDGVQGFWIKIFQNLHKKITDYLQKRLKTRTCPKLTLVKETNLETIVLSPVFPFYERSWRRR